MHFALLYLRHDVVPINAVDISRHFETTLLTFSQGCGVTLHSYRSKWDKTAEAFIYPQGENPAIAARTHAYEYLQSEMDTELSHRIMLIIIVIIMISLSIVSQPGLVQVRGRSLVTSCVLRTHAEWIIARPRSHTDSTALFAGRRLRRCRCWSDHSRNSNNVSVRTWKRTDELASSRSRSWLHRFPSAGGGGGESGGVGQLKIVLVWEAQWGRGPGGALLSYKRIRKKEKASYF